MRPRLAARPPPGGAVGRRVRCHVLLAGSKTRPSAKSYDDDNVWEKETEKGMRRRRKKRRERKTRGEIEGGKFGDTGRKQGLDIIEPAAARGYFVKFTSYLLCNLALVPRG